MKTLRCDYCERDTPHRHMHDCAHGIPETHMAGSERFECEHCGRTIDLADAQRRGIAHLFVLDKE